MKIVCRSSSDIISELLNNIKETILMFLPLQYAVRTSILSRKWRYQWAKLPQLVFDENFNPKSPEDPRVIVTTSTIYEILLLHQGNISKYTLDISNFESCSEIDRLIVFLSWNNIQDFTLRISRGEFHKLPSYMFSCLQLMHLFLRHCIFEPPPTFEGFSKLVSFELREVEFTSGVSISNYPLLEILTLETPTFVDSFSIDCPRLKKKWFIGTIKNASFINAPLLAILSLASNAEFQSENSFDLIKVFGCLPLLEDLHMDFAFLKLLAVQNAPKKLPNKLNYLRKIDLSAIDFTQLDELQCTLCLIRSSPNLQKLVIEMCDYLKDGVQPILGYMRKPDYSNVSLNKLRAVELHYVSGLRAELEFITCLIVKSPELETMQHIDPKMDTVFVRTKSNMYAAYIKMFIELTRFRHASQKLEMNVIYLEVI